jgi:hypothetical protein
LYKRGHFVLEAKQGVKKREQEEALPETGDQGESHKERRCHTGQRPLGRSHAQGSGQAEQYARALPASEGRPPLLIVVDVGHSIEL